MDFDPQLDRIMEKKTGPWVDLRGIIQGTEPPDRPLTETEEIRILRQALRERDEKIEQLEKQLEGGENE